MQALFAEVNDLPADDPLRKPLEAAPESGTEAPPTLAASALAPSSPVLAAQLAPAPAASGFETPLLPEIAPQIPGSVRLPSGHDVTVPDLLGATVRGATEKAGEAGLGLQAIGSGLARAQAPEAGRKVPAGTEIVVRFAR